MKKSSLSPLPIQQILMATPIIEIATLLVAIITAIAAITTTTNNTNIINTTTAPWRQLPQFPSRPSLPSATALAAEQAQCLPLRPAQPQGEAMVFARAQLPKHPSQLLDVFLTERRREEILRRRWAAERALFCQSSESKPAR